MLIDHDGRRIAAKRVLAAAVHVAVVRSGKAVRVIAELFKALSARKTSAAAIDHAADAGEITDLQALYIATDSSDAPDDLVTWDTRVQNAGPFATRGMKIGMTDAAVQDVDRDIFRTGGAAFDGEGSKSGGWTLCRESFGLHDGS
jgi:hypothetical protein